MKKKGRFIMKAIRDELMKSTLGKIVWVVFLITAVSWVVSLIINLLSAVWLGLVTLFDKRSNNSTGMY